MAINVAASAPIMANIDDEGVFYWSKLCSKTYHLPFWKDYENSAEEVFCGLFIMPFIRLQYWHFSLPVLRHDKQCQGSFIWQWCLWIFIPDVRPEEPRLHTGRRPFWRNKASFHLLVSPHELGNPDFPHILWRKRNCHLIKWFQKNYELTFL